MSDLDRAAIERVVHAIGERLDGRWLLVGGAAIALWLDPRRLTEDVDIVSISPTGGERLALLELAEALGLPIESVNSAADFFVRRIDGWDRDVELLHQGPRAAVYRPNATLMILTKVRRLSQRDLDDCELVLAAATRLEHERILAALASLPGTEDEALAERRERLRARLSET